MGSANQKTGATCGHVLKLSLLRPQWCPRQCGGPACKSSGGLSFQNLHPGVPHVPEEIKTNMNFLD